MKTKWSGRNFLLPGRPSDIEGSCEYIE